jgi:calcium-dependent protein kinase
MGCGSSFPTFHRRKRAHPNPKALRENIVSLKRNGDSSSVSGCLNSANRVHYQYIEAEYDIDSDKILGSGYSGPVRIGKNRRNGKLYAIKSFNKNSLQGKRVEFLKNEIEIYLMLDHPNIARLRDVYEDSSFVYIVMELCSGKELYYRLVQRKVFTERDAADTTYQMLLAVQYLHANKVVHRDLKLENFLYENESAEAKLKLIDFGFSKIWVDPTSRMHQMCGSVAYVAPEVLNGSYTDKCDLWSLGVIVFMLLSGQPPFFGNEDRMLAKIEKGQYYVSNSLLFTYYLTDAPRALAQCVPRGQGLCTKALGC